MFNSIDTNSRTMLNTNRVTTAPVTSIDGRTARSKYSLDIKSELNQSDFKFKLNSNSISKNLNSIETPIV